MKFEFGFATFKKLTNNGAKWTTVLSLIKYCNASQMKNHTHLYLTWGKAEWILFQFEKHTHNIMLCQLLYQNASRQIVLFVFHWFMRNKLLWYVWLNYSYTCSIYISFSFIYVCYLKLYTSALEPVNLFSSWKLFSVLCKYIYSPFSNELQKYRFTR